MRPHPEFYTHEHNDKSFFIHLYSITENYQKKKVVTF